MNEGVYGEEMKVSDYVANKLTENGIRHVFMITGGGAMHLNVSLATHPKLETIYNHHEQACAIAAESYARLTGKIALVCVTSGPGGTNAITGVLCAWLDSIPMLVISGQVRYDATARSTGLPMRQVGDQEYDITRAVAPMTKYAVMVTDPQEIRYHMERALYLAKAGRPGPCWLDIPMNVQSAPIDEKNLRPYRPEEDAREIPPPVKQEILEEIIGRIKSGKRPVLLAGSAIRSSGAHDDFLRLVPLLKIPVLTAWNAHDCIPDESPFFFGRPGSLGERSGNFIQQNADFLLSLGCRVSLRQTSFNWKSFARGAFKIVIDIDPLELMKPTLRPDLPLYGNVADWIRALEKALPPEGLPAKEEWLSWCRERKKRYPVVLKEYWQRPELVNPYCFVEVLSRQLPEGQITVTGNGSACVCTFQAAVIKKGQRLYTNSGCATMGYDLPAAIGACLASGRQKIVCLAGDGSIQMNLQELQTIVHNKLPIKIFVLNNNGYHSMRQTLGSFFGSVKVGYDPEGGVSFPDMERIAYAYRIPFRRCSRHEELDRAIAETLKGDSPFICEMMLTIDQPFAPKQSSQSLPDGRIISKPLEDLAPFLDREEFKANMIIDPIQE
jgi:acetolactate synthase-1/2/3 large subunit